MLRRALVFYFFFLLYHLRENRFPMANTFEVTFLRPLILRSLSGLAKKISRESLKCRLVFLRCVGQFLEDGQAIKPLVRALGSYNWFGRSSASSKIGRKFYLLSLNHNLIQYIKELLYQQECTSRFWSFLTKHIRLKSTALQVSLRLLLVRFL